MIRDRPLNPRLSGLPVEYRLMRVYSRDAGRREAKVSFNVGQGTQDLGFRSDVDILFTCDPAVSVVLDVQDDDGRPTMASFLIRDAQRRVYPSPTRRLAPDFFFHPQVYRSSGEAVLLPPGTYTVEFTRGPEYVKQTRTITVPPGREHRESFRLKRWANLAKMNWFSGDHHVHAAGCAHYESPTEGVRPEDMMRHILGEDLDVGCVLSWGPCWYAQKAYFDGRLHPLSTPEHLMRYDIEVSGFPSSHCGHLCLLRLKEDDYPGTTRIEEWPSWDLPVLKWGRSQGGVVGFSHSGWGLKTSDMKLPSFEVPPFDGIGANEYIVDVVARRGRLHLDGRHAGAVGAEHLVSHAQLRLPGPDQRRDRLPVHLRRAGRAGPRLRQARRRPARLRPLVRGDQAGPLLRRRRQEPPRRLPGRRRRGRRAGQRAEARRAGQGQGLGAGRGVPRTRTHARARPSSAPSRSTPSPTGTSSAPGSAGRGPSPSRSIVNGQPVAREEVAADGSFRDVAFEVPIARSSWVALRIYPSSHTNPVFVVVGGKPIRASRKSAEWCLKGVDQCWSQKTKLIRPAEISAAARDAFDAARGVLPQDPGRDGRGLNLRRRSSAAVQWTRPMRSERHQDNGGLSMSANPATANRNGVILLRLGVGKSEFDMPVGSTLADLLRAAGVEADGQEILVDGRKLEEAVVLRPGMIVTLAPEPKSASPERSWRDSLGMFRDDPVFRELVEAVEASREAEKDRS